jgi:hypothetical protein
MASGTKVYRKGAEARRKKLVGMKAESGNLRKQRS